MLCSRAEFWEEIILIAEIEELEELDASEIYPRRLNAKEVLHSEAEIHRKRENLSGESHGDREEFRHEETKDDEGINNDFWAHTEARKEFHLSSSC